MMRAFLLAAALVLGQGSLSAADALSTALDSPDAALAFRGNWQVLSDASASQGTCISVSRVSCSSGYYSYVTDCGPATDAVFELDGPAYISFQWRKQCPQVMRLVCYLDGKITATASADGWQQQKLVLDQGKHTVTLALEWFSSYSYSYYGSNVGIAYLDRLQVSRGMVPPENWALIPAAMTQEIYCYPNPYPVGDVRPVLFRFTPCRTATLEFYDMAGRRIFQLPDSMMLPAQGRAAWDARLGDGKRAMPGAYLMLLRTDVGLAKGKLMLSRADRFD
jgi:hypothetical protein